eukprot:6688969-Alexandrium_andersonii.AAC.1
MFLRARVGPQLTTTLRSCHKWLEQAGQKHGNASYVASAPGTSACSSPAHAGRQLAPAALPGGASA